MAFNGDKIRYDELKIVLQQEKWVVINNGSSQQYDTATVIYQFGLFMLIRFHHHKKSCLLTIFRDQISQSDYHQLCLLIRTI